MFTSFVLMFSEIYYELHSECYRKYKGENPQITFSSENRTAALSYLPFLSAISVISKETFCVLLILMFDIVTLLFQKPVVVLPVIEANGIRELIFQNSLLFKDRILLGKQD